MSETIYVVYEYVPYEGMSEVMAGTKEEIQTWLRRHLDRYPKTDLDDFAVYEETNLSLKDFLSE